MFAYSMHMKVRRNDLHSELKIQSTHRYFYNFVKLSATMCVMSVFVVLQMLIGRLKEFILRFNAQCDSLNPRPRELCNNI